VEKYEIDYEQASVDAEALAEKLCRAGVVA
jgi:hypothetical protein